MIFYAALAKVPSLAPEMTATVAGEESGRGKEIGRETEIITILPPTCSQAVEETGVGRGTGAGKEKGTTGMLKEITSEETWRVESVATDRPERGDDCFHVGFFFYTERAYF